MGISTLGSYLSLPPPHSELSEQMNAKRMQSPRKNYTSTHYDAPMWADWMKPNRTNNSSWDSSLVASLTSDSDHTLDTMEGTTPDTAIPVEYTWTPPTPTLDSDHSSSELSIESPSLSELDELPEIPFITTADVLEPDNDVDHYDFDAVGSSVDERTFWANIIRPNLSRSSSGRPVAVLGQTNHRVLSANRCRSPSVSSESSRTKPPPAKSILSSNSSIRTCKGRSPPSVKFLDAPTIHYESDEEYESEYEASLEFSDKCPEAQSGIFGFFRRFIGSSPKKDRTPERPVISGPIPLWEGSRRRARHSLDEGVGRAGRTPSLRSTRSTASFGSIRSRSSRLQTYWGRVAGKDPLMNLLYLYGQTPMYSATTASTPMTDHHRHWGSLMSHMACEFCLSLVLLMALSWSGGYITVVIRITDNFAM